MLVSRALIIFNMLLIIAHLVSTCRRTLHVSKCRHMSIPTMSTAHPCNFNIRGSSRSRSLSVTAGGNTGGSPQSSSISPVLRTYMQSCFAKSFSERSSDLAVVCDRANIYADKLMSLVSKHSVYAASNADFASIGVALCKSIPFLTQDKLQQLVDGHTELQSILDLHHDHQRNNRNIFDTIRHHHRSIGQEDWTDVARDDEALAKYSQAAAAMGTKKWVMECNEWMESFAVGYFKLGGARKHYLREYFKEHDADFASVAEKKKFIDDFTKDLLQQPNRKQIRLLDVGSCYNPIARSESASYFDVTAIDLYPADQSVLRCDFLNLAVGAADTAPIIAQPAAVEASGTADSIAVADVAERVVPEFRTLSQLSAESFDTVTMSLVLSYLPTPDQRLQMIRKARSLLITPPHSSHGAAASPHRTGLLLIVEKDSIFGSENMVETVGQNKSVLLTNWKQAICNEGFSLVKYRHLKTGEGHMSHVFAFATTAADPQRNNMADTGTCASPNAVHAPKMWIKQDFDSQLGSTEATKRPEPFEVVERCDTRRVLPSRPVGIVGGGIGGCALALSLQLKNIPFVVFEKDECFETRKQGYALTMQQGGPALRALGLGDLLNTHGTISTRHNSYRWDGSRLGTYGLSKRLPVDSDVAVVAHSAQAPPSTGEADSADSTVCSKGRLLKSKTRHNVHIPRQKLREIMMQNINPASVQWSKKLDFVQVQHVQDSTDPIVKVNFTDGTSQELCALVGADGIFSAVRHQLNGMLSNSGSPSAEYVARSVSKQDGEMLKYLGLMVILGIAPNSAATATTDATSPGTSRQQCQWLNGETRVFSMPYDKNHTMWQLSYPCGEAEALAFSGATTTSEADPASTNEAETRAAVGERLKQEALRRCAGWAGELVNLLTTAEPSLVSGHPVYDRDPDKLSVLRTVDSAGDSTHRKSTDDNFSTASDSFQQAISYPACWPITLLGDAAHPMSPFKGQGANQAILDALALSKAISSSNLYGARSTGIGALRSMEADSGLVNIVSNKCNTRRSIAENLRVYEAEMYAKGAEKVQRSRDAAFYLHNESALAEANVTRAKAAEDFAAANRCAGDI